MLMSDKWIRKQCEENEMIVPFLTENVNTLPNGKKMPSAGLSSYGYDIRLGRNFKFFNRTKSTVEVFAEELRMQCPDPLPFVTPRTSNVLGSPGPFYQPIVGGDVYDVCEPDNDLITEVVDTDWLVIPPRGFVLGVSLERIKVPRNISVVCMGKSTLARSGLIVIVTPLEAGWEGYVTLEILNVLDLPVRIHAGMGVTQLQFFQGNEDCDVSYADRNGKYNNQPPEAIPPRL